MALAVTREPLPSSAPFCRGRQCLLGACSPEGPSHPLTPSFAASPLEALSSCAPCLAPHSPDPARRCPAQGPAQSRCSVQPGDRKAGPTWPAPPPQLGLCVRIVLRSLGCCGQEQTLVAQSPPSAHAPQAPLPCTSFLHQAPGRQGACPDPRGVEADAEGAARHSRLENKRCVSAADVLGLVQPPHSQHGVNYLPNESRETSPKRAGPGWGTEALTGDAGPWSTVQPPRAGCPEGHRETGLQNMGAPAAPPQQPRGSVPEGGDPFWGSERTATQSNNLILQTTRSGDET